ncbi:MAG: hypothetical protein HY696_09190 [Deltaproteobacteria bacterium]|nr:hypothetical protein [Deltaproteobacteria bacterium]
MKTQIEKVRKIEYDADEFGHIQCMETATLCKVARGEVDLNQIAINHLAARGMDENGRWIGFDKAKERLLEE